MTDNSNGLYHKPVCVSICAAGFFQNRQKGSEVGENGLKSVLGINGLKSVLLNNGLKSVLRISGLESVLRIDDVLWRAGEKGPDILDGDVEQAATGGMGGPSDVRRDAAVWGGQQGIFGRRRL